MKVPMPDKSVLSLVLMGITVGRAVFFDFHPIASYKSFNVHELLCQNLGYDGLATVSSPEMYAYALKVTANLRQNTGVYIGLRNNSNTNIVNWDDGTLPAVDTPWRSSAKDFSTKRCGNIHFSGSIKSIQCDLKKFSLCGNHKNLPTEAHGRTILGQQPTGVSSSLSVTKVLSDLECVLLCGQDHRCRVAEFNFDLLTCMTLEAGSYTGFTVNSKFQTFVRNGFL